MAQNELKLDGPNRYLGLSVRGRLNIAEGNRISNCCLKLATCEILRLQLLVHRIIWYSIRLKLLVVLIF